jgi:ribosomal protein L22
MADEKNQRKTSGSGKAGEGSSKDEKSKTRGRSRAKGAGGPEAAKEETPARARTGAKAPKSRAAAERQTGDRTEGKGAKAAGAKQSGKAAGGKPAGEKASGDPPAGRKAEGAAKPAPRRRPSARSRARPSEHKPAAARPVVRARAKYVRSSPRKARLLMEHVRGKSVGEARAVLRHSPRGVARELDRLLASAIANAENNHDLVGDDLYVQEIYADEGPTIKRFRPRAQGRAFRIRKRTSHLTVALSVKE